MSNLMRAYLRLAVFSILLIADAVSASIAALPRQPTLTSTANSHTLGAAATPSAPAETINFTYDEATGGPGAKGLLTTVTDASGSTKYQYDAFGRVTSKAQVVASNSAKTQTVSYLPTGQRNEHTLPSGAVVKYSYRADGRVVSIQVNGVTIISELDYFPFGEVKSWKYGANDSYVRAFDSDGRIKEHTSSPGVRKFAFDPGSRITGLTDQPASANDWTFDYDKLDRLKSAENAAIGSNPIAQLKLGWTFDATGNRKSESRAIAPATPVVTNLTTEATSNKLTQVASLARTYDAAGNTINDGAIQSLYSARNRLMQVNKTGVQANYSYNAFGERVSKLVGGQTIEFVYDESGHLLGEYRAADATEIVWLDDTPLAVIEPSASTQGGMSASSAKVYFVQPDHLDTPRVVVNAAKQPVWSWNSAPFGDTVANEQPTASLAAFQFNLRFPGQQFDAETASHYNYFRDYEAGTGRYLQSDPIGMQGGLNGFTYVESQPSHYYDVYGLRRSGASRRARPTHEGEGTIPEGSSPRESCFPKRPNKGTLERIGPSGEATCLVCGLSPPVNPTLAHSPPLSESWNLLGRNTDQAGRITIFNSTIVGHECEACNKAGGPNSPRYNPVTGPGFKPPTPRIRKPTTTE